MEVLEMNSKGFESLLLPNGLWSADRARHAEASLTGTRLLSSSSSSADRGRAAGHPEPGPHRPSSRHRAAPMSPPPPGLW